MEINSKTYAKFKRSFVGPNIPKKIKKQRGIGYSPPMPGPGPDLKRLKTSNPKRGVEGPSNYQKTKIRKEFKLNFVGPIKPSAYMLQPAERKSKWVAYISGRQKRIKIATPPWADMKKIESVYLRAQELNKSTGIPHEVDHIIPITNDLVCGLHVEHNLQILTESDNQSKNNKFTVE